MPRGPLPNEHRRRTNAPVIPTTALPAGGRSGSPPRCPLPLGKPGKAWWRWAWTTPQAAAWSAGDVAVIARRARLEDDHDAIAAFHFDDIPTDPEELVDWLHAVESLVKTLKRLTGGSLAVEREMRELDDRLGLTPKARQALRWVIEEEKAPAPVVSIVDDDWLDAASG